MAAVIVPAVAAQMLLVQAILRQLLLAIKTWRKVLTLLQK